MSQSREFFEIIGTQNGSRVGVDQKYLSQKEAVDAKAILISAGFFSEATIYQHTIIALAEKAPKATKATKAATTAKAPKAPAASPVSPSSQKKTGLFKTDAGTYSLFLPYWFSISQKRYFSEFRPAGIVWVKATEKVPGHYSCSLTNSAGCKVMKFVASQVKEYAAKRKTA
jgi:hypothetical protein